MVTAKGGGVAKMRLFRLAEAAAVPRGVRPRGGNGRTVTGRTVTGRAAGEQSAKAPPGRASCLGNRLRERLARFAAARGAGGRSHEADVALVASRSASRHPVAALALAGLTLAGCTPEPETIIVIESLSAVDVEGEPTGDLFSDVCEGSPSSCVVTNDNALVAMSARAENPYTDISRFGDIVLDRYRVTYVRADGRNTPGLDVPHAFDGAISFRVPVGDPPASKQFMVVRHQAKLEPPLRDLAGGGGAIVISVIAQIDFYGRQLVTDRAVTTRASLNITFADFGE
jgi:hypothetical protein